FVANAVAFACCSFVQATVAAVSARAWALYVAFALAVTHFDFAFAFLTDLQATFAAATASERVFAKCETHLPYAFAAVPNIALNSSGCCALNVLHVQAGFSPVG